MRRHLCFVCLVFVIFLLVIMEIFPYQYMFEEEISDLDIQVIGKVSQKEKRSQDGQISYRIYLEHIESVVLSDKNQYENDEIIQSIQQNTIEGILCYMDTDSYVPNVDSIVCIEGKMYTFRTPKNPGEFDEALYYKTLGMDFKMYQCHLTGYSENYSYIKEKLFRFKEKMCNILEQCFSSKYSGIAKAILLGMKGDLDTETKNLYNRNGVLHVLCVSGTHITVLGMGLYKLLKKIKFSEIIASACSIAIMIVYGMMLGMGTSVFRAILMFSLSLIARLLGRTYDLLTAACVGAIVLLIEQPLYLYHSGFLLSFLSVIALGTIDGVFQIKSVGKKWIRNRKKAFLSTLYIWMFTLPVYAMYYYEVSLSGLILNVIILPFISVLLFLIILSCVLGSIILPLGIWTAKICEMILGGFELLFQCSDAIGNTTLILGKPSVWKCVIFYVGISVLLLMREKIKKKHIYLGLAGLCAVFVIKIPYKEEITCLSVGQGDCAVIEYHNMVCIVDAGSSSEKDIGTYTILPFLKYQGIRKVDYLFLSHSDTDHINGVETLLSQSKTGITIKNVVVVKDVDLESYGTILNLTKEKNIQLCEMKQGDFIKQGNMIIECLGPSENLLQKHQENTNAISMVLFLKNQSFSMLFTGDVEKEGEEEMTNILKENMVEQVTVLKVAHHGSKNSTSEEFLKACNPKISCISCGKDNRYGHPHNETLQRLKNIKSQVYITKEVGAIQVKMKKYMEE